MIKRVRITNFKSLADVSVDLLPVTVLIGRSGTGKTNFVDALRFFRACLLTRGNPFNHPSFQHPEGIMSATASRPVTLGFEVTFDVRGIPGEYHYRLGLRQPQHGGAPSLSEEALSLGDSVLFAQRDGKWAEPPRVVSPPPPGSLVLGAVTGIRETTIPFLVLTNGLGCYDFPGSVLQTTGGPPHTPFPIDGLSDNGDTYLTVFNALVNDIAALDHWREITGALRSLNGSVRDIAVSLPDRRSVLVTHEVDGRALVLNLTQESEGFRRFLAHLLALYQTPPKQTLVFEEPEKGIHPGALATLAEEFTACPRDNRGQVILTTHSPQLLDHFPAEAIRVVEMQHSVTVIGPLAPEQKEAVGEQLLLPGELLTVDPARLPDTLTTAN